MKRLTNILTTMLLLAVVAAGCSEEDEEEMTKFTIDTEAVSLFVNDDYKITPSGAFTTRSADEDVATVNAEGVIHGVSAGNTDIIFTSTENGQVITCKVKVEWRYNYFDEPILDFTMNAEQVKERETHTLVLENRWDALYDGFPEATNPVFVGFSYSNQEIPMLVRYGILDKEQGGIGAISLEMREGREKVALQLQERYGNPSEEDAVTKIFICRRGNFYVLQKGAAVIYSIKPF